MVRNFMCDRCWDEGRVGIIFKKTCPKCNGNPRSMLPPRPPGPFPAPPPKTYHKIYHKEEKRDPLIESWEAYRNNS